MNKFDGKKLLLLGSNVGTLDLISYAKTNGAYTIVADNLPKERSVGKQYADKSVLISTADIANLKNLILKEGIHGVFAGISEFNLLSAMKLCDELSLPFYCTREQWDRIEDKEQFRILCINNGIPVPHTFFFGATLGKEEIKKISYPVIVKPVDSSSSIGVSICRTESQLINAIVEATGHSEKKRIIIEEFFEGEEFTAHYTIVGNNVSLSCVDNRIPVTIHHGDVTSIPIARVYPSSFIDEYIKQVNDGIIRLCKSLRMECGVMFVQGLYNKTNNKFVIFEAGLRCAGEAPYRFLEIVNGVNFMNNFVDFALLGKVNSISKGKGDPYLKGKYACVTSFVSKGGVVGNIINYDDIEKKVTSIIDKECRYRIGDNTPSGDTLRQIMLRFVLLCDSKEQLIRDDEKINQTIMVLNDKGEDMCLRFNAREYYTM